MDKTDKPLAPCVNDGGACRLQDMMVSEYKSSIVCSVCGRTRPIDVAAMMADMIALAKRVQALEEENERLKATDAVAMASISVGPGGPKVAARVKAFVRHEIAGAMEGLYQTSGDFEHARDESRGLADLAESMVGDEERRVLVVGEGAATVHPAIRAAMREELVHVLRMLSNTTGDFDFVLDQVANRLDGAALFVPIGNPEQDAIAPEDVSSESVPEVQRVGRTESPIVARARELNEERMKHEPDDGKSGCDGRTDGGMEG